MRRIIASVMLLSVILSMTGCLGKTESRDQNTTGDKKKKTVKIYTAEQLQEIEENPAGNYMLANDIDLSDYANWEPLCSDKYFTGTLDGNGYCILNLNVDVKDGGCAGLFYGVSGATFKDLGIVGGKIQISSSSYGGSAGAFAGVSEKRRESERTILTQVENCYVNATVESKIIENGSTSYGATMSIGSFFGEGSADFMNCYNLGKTRAASSYADQIIGGFIGEPDGFLDKENPMTIQCCYNAGPMSSNWTSGDKPGAFLGYTTMGPRVDIIDSYYINGYTEQTSEYYRKAVTDCSDSDFTSVSAVTLAQMKNESTFAGFDFDKTWAISPDVNGGFPYLQSQKNIHKNTGSTATDSTDTEDPQANLSADYLQQNIIGRWNGTQLYIFYIEGSCRMLFDDAELGTYSVDDDKTLTIEMPWVKKELEWNPESVLTKTGWYYTTDGKLVIEGQVLNRVESDYEENDQNTSSDSNNHDKTDSFNTLNIDEITLVVGESYKLKYGNATECTWSSANPNIASVTSDGLVTAVNAGVVRITVSYQGTQATCTVRVVANKSDDDDAIDFDDLLNGVEDIYIPLD